MRVRGTFAVPNIVATCARTDARIEDCTAVSVTPVKKSRFDFARLNA